MLELERELWDRGVEYVAGVDEVGRGCLFGDVVAAAVILPKFAVIDGVNDSKKLSEKMRNHLYDEIVRQGLAFAVASVDVATIERINIKQAARLAMKMAVQALKIRPEHLLIDAERVDLPIEQTAVIHGDALSQSIAAASIVAKVTRDRLCERWDEQYPGYGIAQHKGYATVYHRMRIVEMGATAMHRPTFLRKLNAAQEAERQAEQMEFLF
ncbi:MAG: ribonuclease [Paenibacillaceae bacterium]|nr:ribonuclease [Paenibacillaceae bacterium]